MTSEPIIICPKCKTEIKLNESLAAPLVESVRREYEARLNQKDAAIAKRETALHDREEAILKEREDLDAQVAEKIAQERARIVADEAKKARFALANEIDQKTAEVTELQDILKARDQKLAEAQKAQADLIRKQRELDDEKREIELTIEKRIEISLSSVRDQARKEGEDSLRLKMMENEQKITSLQKTIDELKRQSEQGSQQLQGEVQELEIEAILLKEFPRDLIQPVPKGEYGGDILQRVIGPLGQSCGTILWECKRTKNWSDGWLVKLREDQRAAKAEIAVLVTQALPKGTENFDLVDGIWITPPRMMLPVALVLRQMLTEVSSARLASEGQQTKAEMVYEYLTGPRFRHRVQAIIEAFSSMREDLDRERKVITKQWAKREEQTERVLRTTVGMYGDLQGIAGKSIQEIDGLEIKELEAGVPTKDA